MDFICGTTLVHLKMRCWSGEKKASREEDINVGVGGQLPPVKLLDIGRKKIFPPTALNPLMNKRKEAERMCLAVGTRFMGGYAIPDDYVDGLIARLNDIQENYLSLLDDFLLDFEDNKKRWLDENDEYAHILKDQVPTVTEVKNSFEFNFKFYKLNPLEGFEPAEDEISNQVLHEIGISCKLLSDNMMDRKRPINGLKLIKQLEPLTTKLLSLSFGNGRILKVLNEFNLLIDSIPINPPDIMDQDNPLFGVIVSFLSICSDSDKLDRILDGEFSVANQLAGIQKPLMLLSGCESTSKTSTIKQSVITSGAYF